MSEKDYKAEIHKINGRYYVRAGWWPHLNEWLSPDLLGIWFVSDLNKAKGYRTLRGADRGARRWVRWMRKTDARKERHRSHIERAESGSLMLKWLKGALDHWAVSAAKSASDNFEAECYLRKLRRKAYIRAKARDHIEIMRAVREMEKAD